MPIKKAHQNITKFV